MLGKKALVLLVGSTAGVTAGVPAAIVVGQQVAKHETLESKMTQKWSDIERELAASFGGFDIRKQEDVQAKEESLRTSRENYANLSKIASRIIGKKGNLFLEAYDDINPNENQAFYNSLVSEYKNVDTSILLFKNLMTRIMDTIANEAFDFRNDMGFIVPRTGAFQNNADIKINTERPFKQDGTPDNTRIIIKGITVSNVADPKTNATSNINFLVPTDINIVVSIDKDSSPKRLMAQIDSKEIEKFFLSFPQISEYNKLIKDISSEENELDLESIAQRLYELLTDTTSGKRNISQIIGVKEDPETFENNTFAGAFGLRGALDALKIKGFFNAEMGNVAKDALGNIISNGWTRDFLSIIKHLETMSIESALSLEGHHNKELNRKFIQNGMNFVDPKFDDTEFAKETLFAENPDWKTELLELPLDKNGENLVDAKIESWNRAQRENGESGSMFTNQEVIQWQKEGGFFKTVKMVSMDEMPIVMSDPGEKLELIAPLIRENKVNSLTLRDWTKANDFVLIRNEDKFISTLNKFNLSFDDIYMDIKDETGKTITISNNTTSSYRFDTLFSNDVYSEDEELFSIYPSASPEWINRGFAAASSRMLSSINGDSEYVIANEAPFHLNLDSAISFRLKIDANNREFSNVESRTPQIFRANSDGELYVDDEARK